MSDCLYLINNNDQIENITINEHSLNEIIDIYKSRNTIITAISVCNEQLFFDSLDSLILGLNYVNKYYPHSDDYWH